MRCKGNKLYHTLQVFWAKNQFLNKKHIKVYNLQIILYYVWHLNKRLYEILKIISNKPIVMSSSAIPPAADSHLHHGGM